ncbi:RtcB family protein [Candidatus Oleimmundimicrobium sp.]|uniref:RtcB family protein n=1 Tax=Candidatus Oleimmundimicrobium sp. TaxID=3060597 RepID=UPI00271B97B9|nr:RtcB family protein [Candidatus Oleimmundimicrobium sp.]MDO8886373.1 RtcB family protein [Candidatus Oleimmundimicrobium sp.]
MANYLEKVGPYSFKIPKSYRKGMRVPGIIYADDELLLLAKDDKALEQVINVAFLPGIVKASFAMPDIHRGYGFPIGGVAATDVKKDGTISPGGVGFDISCGVRLLKTNILASEAAPLLKNLMHELSRSIPKGVGRHGEIILNQNEMKEVLATGVGWVVKQGYAWEKDLICIEEKGCLGEANPDKVSKRAFERGHNQLGTLGAGNHFIEVQEVIEVYDEQVAEAFGLFKKQLVVSIHSGSRGFGHQVCSDYIKVMNKVVKKLGFELPDRQLSCAPVSSAEGKDYYAAMACAANYAMANRQFLTYWTRQSFENIFKKSAEALGMTLLYDVSHNLAKFENHMVDGKNVRLCVHRKGATRAFGPNLLPKYSPYHKIGQPVIIPGDMGRASYILVGTNESENEAFSSTCHGAGRVMSRSEAKRKIKVAQLKKELAEKGVVVEAGHDALLVEEAPEAYKDVSKVVAVCDGAKLSKKVVKLKPLGVLKG